MDLDKGSKHALPPSYVSSICVCVCGSMELHHLQRFQIFDHKACSHFMKSLEVFIFFVPKKKKKKYVGAQNENAKSDLYVRPTFV